MAIKKIEFNDLEMIEINGKREKRYPNLITVLMVEKLLKENRDMPMKVSEIKKNLPKGNIFKCKVWVPWFEIGKPFFMADECFFGLKETSLT